MCKYLLKTNKLPFTSNTVQSNNETCTIVHRKIDLPDRSHSPRFAMMMMHVCCRGGRGGGYYDDDDDGACDDDDDAR